MSEDHQPEIDDIFLSRISHLESELSALQEKYDSLKDKHKTLVSDHSTLKVSLDQLRYDSSSSVSTIEQLQGSISEVTAELSSVTSELKALQLKYNSDTQASQREIASLKEISSTASHHEAKGIVLSQSLSEANKVILSLRNDYQFLKGRLATLINSGMFKKGEAIASEVGKILVAPVVQVPEPEPIQVVASSEECSGCSTSCGSCSASIQDARSLATEACEALKKKVQIPKVVPSKPLLRK